MSDTPRNTAIVYVGTYTQQLLHVHGQAEGILVYHLDRGTGALEYVSTASGVVNPSFVTVTPDHRYLYAVQEVDEHEGQPGGAVTAFAIDQPTHALRPLNHQSTHGAHPCYVSLDGSGRWLFVTNYSGGNLAVLPILEDGSLGPATAVVQHEGSSGQAPHPRAILPDPSNRFVLVPDAGLNRVYVYRLDAEPGTLTPNDPPWAQLPPGTGPRHLAFAPRGGYLYTINESGSTLSAYAYDAEQGVLHELQTVSTLPDGFTGRNSCADIHLDPSGRYLYGSNRGHDSIAIFAVDSLTGQLRLAGHMATGGRTPRNFAIDPGGLLLAANQDSSTVVVFRIDPTTGALVSGRVVPVPTPVCLCIVDLES